MSKYAKQKQTNKTQHKFRDDCGFNTVRYTVADHVKCENRDSLTFLYTKQRKSVLFYKKSNVYAKNFFWPNLEKDE